MRGKPPNFSRLAIVEVVRWPENESFERMQKLGIDHELGAERTIADSHRLWRTEIKKCLDFPVAMAHTLEAVVLGVAE